MQNTTFTYCNHTFNVIHDTTDESGLGSILEIVTRNDYELNRFTNYKDKVFIDIGANIGIATLIMAKLNPESIVYTFEPNKKVFDMLVKNIHINSLTNVKAYNLAVSNKTNKQLKLSILNIMSGASSTYADQQLFYNQWNDNSYQIVDCISFDDILINNNITEVCLLKIDCEGAEFDIIYDSDLIKNKVIKNIVGEFHDLKYNKALNRSQELLNYCQQYVNGIVKISILVI